MILHYFIKKENKEEKIARNQYKIILTESKNFINDNNFFKEKIIIHLLRLFLFL